MNANWMIGTVSLVAMLLINVVCTKDDNQTVNHRFEINSGELFVFDLGGIPTEGMIVLTNQAQHFVVSEIASNLYKYQSVDHFKGREHVVMERRESRGDSNFNLITVIEIEFIVQ